MNLLKKCYKSFDVYLCSSLKFDEKTLMTNAFDGNDVMVFDNDNGRDINQVWTMF